MTQPKVVLITGAARRIGKSIAQLLHSKGMRIIIHYRSAEAEANTLRDELNQLRADSAQILYANLTLYSDLEALIAQAAAIWGCLDCLVNNASAFFPTLTEQTTEQQWQELIDVNLKAPFFLSTIATPWLKKNQGSIINIADIHAEKPMQDYAIYCISKAGLIMATKALARELAPEIRVNAISPGVTIWPEHENELNIETKKKIISRIALGRKGEAMDIAKAVLFFIESADYITGQVLAIDGGRLLSG